MSDPQLTDLLRQLRHQIAMDTALGVEALAPGTMNTEELEGTNSAVAQQVSIDTSPIPFLTASSHHSKP